MILQVEDPMSSILLQKTVKDGEELLLITQIRGVRYTKTSEFDAYFNELGKGTTSATRRLIDSNFVAIPAAPLRRYLESKEDAEIFP